MFEKVNKTLRFCVNSYRQHYCRAWRGSLSL